MRCPAKLIGGRYDGDRGVIRSAVEVPEFLWAFDCPAGSFCQGGGIHWTWKASKAAEHSTAELYRHTGFDGEHDEMPVAIYVAAPDDTPMDVLLTRETAHA